MSEQYDVIIAGGGYAGLSCGLKLKGKRVLLIEARKEIARKHRGCQCSLYPIGETFTVDGADITFHQNNITVPNALMATLTHLEFASGGHKLTSTVSNPMPIIDEAKIKGVVETMCRESGVEIITGTNVTSVDTAGQRACVYAGKKYEADYLVGADGAHSLVARQLPLTRRKVGNFMEMEVEAERMDIPPNGFYAEMRNIAVGLYAQPYGEGYMLGVFQGMGLNGKRIDLKEYLEESLHKLKAEGITRRYGCSMPIHLSASSSYHKNVIMAGDSVASFSMITITGALLMGYLAGEAVLNHMDGVSSAFEEYDRKWRKILQQGSMDRMRHLFFLLKRLNEKRMPRLVRALEGPDLASVGKGYYLKRIPAIIGAFL
jgi:flavin-dependent dehydrogenase